MNRAAIYARFSSDRQTDRSIADQVALCRAWAAREGFVVVDVFEDHAISGASMHGRHDMTRMLSSAAHKSFDIVIAESMSRIGRDEEDRAAIRKRLTFHGVRMATPSDGFVSPLVDGIRAVIDSVYLDDLKKMVRRGMAGVVREGRSAGGRAYGYRPVPGEAGKLAIVPAEAAIVAEIFERYAQGETPRAIAGALNRRAIKPPRGKSWNASTISGNARRGNGILANELYAGRLVWNKVQMVKDPDTGKRLSRANPPEQWQRCEAPDLSIVTAAAFEAVQNRKARRRHEPKERQRAPRRILSGLLRCAACGGGLSIYGKDKEGHDRVRCTTYAESRACPAPHSFRLDAVEALTVGALRAEFQHPAVLAEYVRTYHAERKRLAGSSARRRGEIGKRMAELDRGLARATEALLDGIGDRAALDLRSKQLRAERDALERELKDLPNNAEVIALHPAALDRYAAQIARLEAAIGGTVLAGDQEAIGAIRDLVTSVTVKPGKAYGAIEVEIEGRLARLIGGDAYPHGRKLGGAMVAEEGLEPPTYGL